VTDPFGSIWRDDVSSSLIKTVVDLGACDTEELWIEVDAAVKKAREQGSEALRKRVAELEGDTGGNSYLRGYAACEADVVAVLRRVVPIGMVVDPAEVVALIEAGEHRGAAGRKGGE
jgi:hypothetical protein